MTMTIESIKTEANANAKILVDYLRSQWLISESVYKIDRDYRDSHEEILHGAALAAYELARKIAAI